MGLTTSKSPLERRNTVIKRSQRKSIHTIKSKIDKLFTDIKKFRGTEEDDKYKVLVTEIGRLNYELNSKIRDLQPQVRNIHQVTVARLDEAVQALQAKVLENRQKQQEKMKKNHNQDEEDLNENTSKSVNEEIEVNEETEEGGNQASPEQTNESQVLENSTDKRKTLELKFVQVIPENSIEAEVHNEQMSPNFKRNDEKRKSILKMGVPVMPGAMLEEITKKTNQMSVHYDTTVPVPVPVPAPAPVPVEDSDALLAKLGDTVENLQKIEYQIADFVGKKHGTQYNRIKDKLVGYMHEVTQIRSKDDFVVDQVQLCTNYLESCLRFLDDKAVENNKDQLQDDVFLPEQNNNTFDAQTKLQKLMKTTAI
ncbi:unnamed protein product [Phaedon cochleariae]|uniref:Uncharacterized protein n=1 Tax=Phaedon cochleariae TaxID=80249 RepID=A0A9P0GP28_PHACE|nr:unnamed protein product [Phaedon cochleariae]